MNGYLKDMGHFFCTWCHFFCTWAIFFAHHCMISSCEKLLLLISLSYLILFLWSTLSEYFLLMILLSILIALLTGAHPSWQSLKPTNFSNKNMFPAIKFNTKLITIFFNFREALIRAVIIHGLSIISK